MKVTPVFAALLAGIAVLAPAQTFDTSGNGQLSGTFNFREVALQVGDTFGDFGETTTLYGTISFDGNGNYSLTGSIDDSVNGSGSFPTTTGTYSISASGLGFLSSPLFQGVAIYGLVSNGIFIGSSTESFSSSGGPINDLFIAAPATPQVTNANFSGTYWIANVDFPSTKGDPTVATSSLFQVNPDGNGNLGTVSVNGYIGGSGTTVTQNISGATYSFTSGVGNLAFGGTASSQTLITGNRILYISPDGNFIFGGSASDWDFFVGVRTNGSTAPAFTGLYYQAGLDEDESDLANNGALLDTYWGSFDVSNGNVLLQDQRLASPQNSSAFDYVFSDPFALNADGMSYSDSSLSESYIIGAGGAIRIGSGTGTVLGLSVALQAPTFSGSGVYIYPNGISNSASSAPFTAGISPGQFITLYGTGLASDTVVASSLPFPTTLGGVKVMINGREAPIYYVSPGQISVLVPYATELTVADIQVINNGAASNTVVTFVNHTEVGIFTNPTGGLGYALAIHKDGSRVSPSSPAQPGETIEVFLTGLGAVNPPIADGAAGPTNPLSWAVNQPAAYVQGNQLNVTYYGLVPTLAGLYQLNIQIPTGLTAGDSYLDVAGPDSYLSEALISIGTGTATASAARPSARTHRVVPKMSPVRGLVRRAVPTTNSHPD